MSDGIIIAIITASGALMLGLINLIIVWRNNSKKERLVQHTQLINRLEKIEGSLEVNGRGVQGLLRFELYELWGVCQKKGFASDMDQANFLSLYDRYHSMGKNGIMDNVKDQFLNLPLNKKVVKNKKEENVVKNKKEEKVK